ncbi:hypothetical protein [Streptomyces collinus]
MQPISGKVKASTVAASVTTVLTGIVAPHVFSHGVPSDVRGLIEGVVTGGVTFAFGWLAKHGIDGEALAGDVEAVAADLGVPFSTLSQAPDDAPEAPTVVAVGGDASNVVVG